MKTSHKWPFLDKTTEKDDEMPQVKRGLYMVLSGCFESLGCRFRATMLSQKRFNACCLMLLLLVAAAACGFLLKCVPQPWTLRSGLKALTG